MFDLGDDFFNLIFCFKFESFSIYINFKFAFIVKLNQLQFIRNSSIKKFIILKIYQKI